MMMSDEVARALLVMNIRREDVNRIHEAEALLKPNEYLSVPQIARQLKINTQIEATEEEVLAMANLWTEFSQKILWKQQQIEEGYHPPKCTMFACYHPWDSRCKTKYQEMWQWEAYAILNYKKPANTGNLQEQLG